VLEKQVLDFGKGAVLPIAFELAHTAFEIHAKESSSQAAVEKADLQLNYGLLNKMSDTLSYHLVKNGVKNGDYIPLITTRSFEMVIGMLACLKAGAAFISIDCSLPLDRIATILEESHASIVLVHDDCPLETSAEIKNKYLTLSPFSSQRGNY